MPHKQACPHCGAILTLPDTQSGRAVRCDHCQVIFLAQDFAPAAPTESTEAEQAPEQHWPVYSPPEPPLIHFSETTKRNLLWLGIALAVVLMVSFALYMLIVLSLEAGTKKGGGNVVAAPQYVAPAGAPPAAAPWPAPTASPTTPAPAPVPVGVPSGSPQAVAPAERPVGPGPVAPPPPTTTEVFAALTDEQVDGALQAGVLFLLKQLDNGVMRPEVAQRGQYGPGLDALCANALLQGGAALHDPRLTPQAPFMSGLLDHLRDEKIDAKETMYCTYAHSLRASALATAGRSEDRDALEAELQWLLSNQHQGAYSYNETGAPAADNSNSQYGLLGVWAVAETGHEIPVSYWEQVQKYWISQQRDDGGWSYPDRARGDVRVSMTSAGIASLFVTHDYLDPARFGNQVGREPFSPELKKGLDRFESRESELLLAQPAIFDGYTVYGIERVGLASGFKFFGKTDWYRHLASDIIVNRLPAAIQNTDVVDACFYMMFLARGSHALIMNKLRYDGDWANRPRDVANLSRYASHDLERQFNWHVVPVTLPWNEWFDAPILELSSAVRPQLSDEQVDNLRQYILNGGMLLTNADGGSKAFDAYVHELAAKLFPQYPMKDVPADHFFFDIEYRIDKPPQLQYVSNGVRALIVHSPGDLAQYWQVRSDKQSESAFQLGVNFFVVAAGKSDYRNRLETLYIPPVSPPAREKMVIAQLNYNGNWNPEPAALTRFGRLMERDENIGIETISSPIPLVKREAAPLACLMGTEALDLSLEEANSLRSYVETGGVLLIEPAGGSQAFYDRVLSPTRALCWPGSQFKALLPTHPLLNGSILGSHALPAPHVRSFASDRPDPVDPHIQYFRYGKGVVILAPLDLRSGLLGTNTWGIAGYTPDYAQAFMKNLVLWVRSGAHEPVEGN